MSPTDHVLQRGDRRTLLAIGIRILLFELLRDRFQVGQRRLDRHAVLQPPDAVQPMTAASLVALALRMKGRPEFSGLRGREVKVPRQHADDDVGDAVEDDGLAEHVHVSGVPLLPGGIAQQHGVRRSRQIFAGTKITAELRRHAERAKEPVADASAADWLRLA